MKNFHKIAALSVALFLAAVCFTGCRNNPASTDVGVISVTVQSTLSLVVGDSEILTATIFPAIATNKNVSWKSDKPAVATVDAVTGKVTAVAAGTATITATTEDGGKIASCEITVTDATIEGAMYVGYFGGELVKSASGVWKFTRKLYIQDRDESTGIEWATESSATNVTDMMDGKGNTWKLRSADYPAANLCFEKNSNVTGVSDLNYIWYLPAQNQLLATSVVYNSFETNEIWGPYWSATEVYPSSTWYVGGNSIYGVFNVQDKSSVLRVRCVREL